MVVLKLGIATVSRIAAIASVTISSISVKPFSLFMVLYLIPSALPGKSKTDQWAVIVDQRRRRRASAAACFTSI
jgi:hypothetical protein